MHKISDKKVIDTLKSFVKDNNKFIVVKDLDPYGVGSYAEAGMRARITDLSYSEKDESYRLILNYKDFEGYNKQFEKNNYYDSEGIARLDAHQAGFYSVEEEIYISEEDLINGVEIPDFSTNITGKLLKVWKDSGQDVSYTEFVEMTAAQALGLVVDETPTEQLNLFS
jgi:hypothetical protein